MEIKIYREPENVNLLLDEKELTQYYELTQALGIPQVKENKIPSVYQPLNQVQIRAIKALCPASSYIEHYSRSTIPVEVLHALKLAKDHEMFDLIEIWYDDKTPDPVVIGKRFNSDEDREKNYTWRMNHSLVARWGDCAYELNELTELGKQRLINEYKDKAIEFKQKVEAFLSEPELHVNRYLETGNINFER